MSNVDSQELARFDSVAARWWDLQGPFRPLHELNPQRLAFIAQRQPLAGMRVVDIGCGGGIMSEALARAGAEVVALPDARGKVDLTAMLRDLARREVNEVHVEAGHKLNGSLLREGLVDELLLYQAPLLLGEGQGIAALGPLAELAQGTRLEWRAVDHIGPDLRVRARMAGREPF